MDATTATNEHPGFRAVVDDCIDDVWHLSRRLMPDEDAAVFAVIRTFLRAREALPAAGPCVAPRTLVLEICAGVCREYHLATAPTPALPVGAGSRWR